MQNLFRECASDLSGVIHCAAQPSHDWAARDPFKDFTVNANGTLVLLEMTRKYVPEAVFIFTSTNKVYGDLPNSLPLVEKETRWELEDHTYAEFGIDEAMSIDQSKHSLFGASKVAADVLVQEYGRYFGMPTVCLRGGCLTGPSHSGVQLHGFLSFLIRSNLEGNEYKIFGTANHAGTTPMRLRHDAGYVASAISVGVRRLVKEMGGHQIGTVGVTKLNPSLVNVIAKEALITIDLRNTDDQKLKEAEQRLKDIESQRLREIELEKMRKFDELENQTIDEKKIKQEELTTTLDAFNIDETKKN